jgi:uncharacterized protein involved in exopolysaccharide biosynthesis
MAAEDQKSRHAKPFVFLGRVGNYPMKYRIDIHPSAHRMVRMVTTLWRRKWLVIVPVVVSILTTAVVSYVMPTRYRSEALVLVVPQRVPEGYVQAATTTKIADRLLAISQLILSRTRLERVIRDFDLYADERRSGIMEDVIHRMREDIEVQMVKGDAFRVSYLGNDPRVVMRVTERLSSLYIEESLRDREVLAEGTMHFLEAQIEQKRKDLTELEEQVQQFRRENGSRSLPRAMQIEQEVLEETYRAFLTKQEDSKVAANLERRQIGEQFKLLDPARLPEKPLGPSTFEVNLMGAFAGLGIGFVLVGASSLRRNRAQ